MVLLQRIFLLDSSYEGSLGLVAIGGIYISTRVQFDLDLYVYQSPIQVVRLLG